MTRVASSPPQTASLWPVRTGSTIVEPAGAMAGNSPRGTSPAGPERSSRFRPGIP